MKREINLFIISAILIAIFALPVLAFEIAKSGCCSHHGGVCSCDSGSGRQVCCDGTYSPSCTCYKATNASPAITDASLTVVVKNYKADYQKNPNGFREKLITNLNKQFKINNSADWVYKLLPDIK